MPALPAGQETPSSPGTTAAHTHSNVLLQPHPRGPGRPPSPIKGFSHFFTIIDRASRWLEAIPIAATTPVDCANALFQGWVSRFGVPAVITSDQGTQFTSSLCSLLNIQHTQTTAYHPQSNGMVERFHHPLKDALRACCFAWSDHLPWILVGLRSAAREDDGTILLRQCSAHHSLYLDNL